MIGVITLVLLGICIVGIIWKRRRWQLATTSGAPAAVPPATLALHAFAHGNSCLAAGQWDDALHAFHQVLEFEPKHPHVAGRIAEVERRRQAASATPPALSARMG